MSFERALTAFIITCATIVVYLIPDFRREHRLRRERFRRGACELWGIKVRGNQS